MVYVRQTMIDKKMFYSRMPLFHLCSANVGCYIVTVQHVFSLVIWPVGEMVPRIS